MRHTDKYFWQYATAYILLGPSLLLLLMTSVERVFFSQKLDLGGAALGLLGSLMATGLLGSLKRRRTHEEAPHSS